MVCRPVDVRMCAVPFERDAASVSWNQNNALERAAIMAGKRVKRTHMKPCLHTQPQGESLRHPRPSRFASGSIGSTCRPFSPKHDAGCSWHGSAACSSRVGLWVLCVRALDVQRCGRAPSAVARLAVCTFGSFGMSLGLVNKVHRLFTPLLPAPCRSLAVHNAASAREWASAATLPSASQARCAGRN